MSGERLAMSSRADLVELYGNQRVSSDCGYPTVYRYREKFREQVREIQSHFLRARITLRDPDLGFIEQPLIRGAEGFFAVPRWELIGGTYGEAVKKLLACFENVPKLRLQNCLTSLDKKHLLQTERSVRFWKKISQQQKRDILVVPAHFGQGHAGASTQLVEALIEKNRPSECSLGLFAVGCMLLTHPERLGEFRNSLWINCSGDRCTSIPDGHYRHVPAFNAYGDGEVRLEEVWVDEYEARTSHPSGFLSDPCL